MHACMWRVRVQALLVYDALSVRFSRVKLRARRADCEACSPGATLRSEGGVAGYDYQAFTGAAAAVEGAAACAPSEAACASCGDARDAADSSLRVSPRPLASMLGGPPATAAVGGGSLPASEGGRASPILLVDVRPQELYEAARLPGSMHVAMREVRSHPVPASGGCTMHVALRRCAVAPCTPLAAAQCLSRGAGSTRCAQMSANACVATGGAAGGGGAGPAACVGRGHASGGAVPKR
jgi:hypothetical protein